MRIPKVLPALAAAALIFTAAKKPSRPLLRESGVKDVAALRMSPLAVLGPQAIPTVAGPQYGLFRCQVGLDPSGRVCYDPYQMRHAYGVDSLIAAGFDATGRTIVIVDAFQNPNLVSQVATYDAFYGLPATNLTIIAPDGLTPFNPSNGDQVSWAEEISLDVEWAHNMAPGANIVLVLSKSDMDADLVSALKYAVDNNLGDVISMSFGESESCVGLPGPDLVSTYHDVFAEATQKGITLFASSGDEGAAQPTCDGTSWMKSASYPASDPLVTGVGATELHAANYCLTALGCNPGANPLPGTYEGEIAWNEGPPYGDFQNLLGNTEATGGGFSVIFGEPSYQEGTAGLHGGKQRAVPDVAYSGAIFHGALTYLDIPGIPSGYYLFGGTSCGSPQWAAITAIADQKGGGRLGFITAAIYQIAKHIDHVNPAHPASLQDITSGTNSAVEFDSMGNPVNTVGFFAGTGWDATTGSGSPNEAGIADFLIQYVLPGDGPAAIAESKPNPHARPNVPGHMHAH
jgi:subtilase family serine protease